MNHKSFPQKTAGRLMVPTDKVPMILAGTAVNEVESLLKNSHDFVSLNYIYVVDNQNRLNGVFSIKEFLGRKSELRTVDELMTKNLVTVRTHTHQERAAFLALRHQIKAVPVIDHDGVFLGVITHDSLVQVLDQEAVEDILRFGGIYHKGTYDDLLKLSAFKSIKHRLPWLLIGMLGGLVAAGIIGGFEEILSENLILVSFIPLIVYMAAAVATQLEAFIIRDLAINLDLSFPKYFLKQVSVVSLLGLISSVVLAAISLVFYQDAKVSLVLGIALFFAILSSVFSGLIVPFVFGRLKLDPANASGPIATIIQDLLSVLVYFSVASLLL